MGKALDTVSGRVTAPGAALTAWTVNAGDSLQVRNADPTKKSALLSAWFNNQVAGTSRIRSPKLHDSTQGIRTTILAADIEPFIPFGYGQRLYPQDALIVEQSGSGVGGQIETGSLLVYYEDLPGAASRLIAPDELAKRMQNVFTVENPIVPGVTGDYTGAAALNATFDLFKANTDYALMGYLLSARCGTVAWRGADSSNMRVSGPGESTKRDVTSRWFIDLSAMYGMPLIPVFNSANRAGITVDVQTSQAGTATTVTTIMAELS